MQTKLKKLPKAKAELEIELDASEFEQFFEKAIINVRKNIQIPGFRKGKIPKEMVFQKIGTESILSEAAKLAIEDSYKKVILRENLEPISQPHIEILKLAPQNPFLFKAIFFVLPGVELPDYQSIASKIKKNPISVSEKEVDETLQRLQKIRPNLKQVFRPAKKGDFIEIEFSCAQIENNKPQKDEFILGKGFLAPGFEDNLEGIEPGQKKEFSLKFPEKHFQQDLADKDIAFKVEMKKVQEMELLEINDDFARKLGNFENLEILKQSIKTGIEQEKNQAESQKVRQEILEAILKQCPLEIPDTIVQQEKQRMLEENKKFSKDVLKISFEDYLKKLKKSEQELLDSLEKEAEKRTQNFLILRKIAHQEKIEVSEQEVEQEINKFLNQYPDVKKAKENIDPTRLREYTKERIVNEKTLTKLESFISKS